jgi:ABC-2 type transport system ATP-binding protein
MNVLSLKNVCKTYTSHKAVDDVSFDVGAGTIFGLLGPNGAGKTSLIRIITGITAADSGTVWLNGEKLHRLHPHQIGYMPEERGLYKKMKVGEQLEYLIQLKGFDRQSARKKLRYWLEKFDILSWYNKPVGDLSKGMSQKVQFIATIAHEPSLIILDEPFSGLDPVNANLIKDEIYNLKKQGASILFSTHRMEQVEEICDDIVLIHQGRIILQGGVSQVKNSFKQHMFRISYEGVLPGSFSEAGFRLIKKEDSEITVQIQKDMKPNELLMEVIRQGVQIQAFHEILPSLNDIFIQKVTNTHA